MCLITHALFLLQIMNFQKRDVSTWEDVDMEVESFGGKFEQETKKRAHDSDNENEPKAKKAKIVKEPKEPKEKPKRANKPRKTTTAFYVNGNRSLVGDTLELETGAKFSVTSSGRTATITIQLKSKSFTLEFDKGQLVHVKLPTGETFQVLVQPESKDAKFVLAEEVRSEESDGDSTDECTTDDFEDYEALFLKWSDESKEWVRHGDDANSVNPEDPVLFLEHAKSPKAIEDAFRWNGDGNFVYGDFPITKDMRHGFQRWMVENNNTPQCVSVRACCLEGRKMLKSFEPKCVKLQAFLGDNFLQDLNVRDLTLCQSDSWKHARNLPESVKSLKMAGDFVFGYPPDREPLDLSDSTIEKLTILPDKPLSADVLKFLPKNLTSLKVCGRWPEGVPTPPYFKKVFQFWN